MGNPPQQLSQESHASEKSSTWAAIAREFYVDLLGSLVPGLLFTIMAALPVWWSASLVWKAARTLTNGGATTLDSLSLGQFRVEILCLFFVLSYVLGCVFYRRDPKIPDQKSAAYILWQDLRRKTADERNRSVERCVIQPPEGTTLESFKNACLLVEGEGGQFPYSHMYEYLAARGLQHLAGIVPWRGKNPATIGLRTKMFINLLKVRLQYVAPQKCSEIVRNEAHIRMMSSVWYAAVTLQHLCYVAAALAVFSALPAMISHPHGILNVSLEPLSLLFFLLILFLAAGWLRLTIRRFFHYQRVREIIYVLETAYWAKTTACPEILDNLN